jgi:hypothetical protein
MEVFAILPWDQDGSDEAVLTEIPGLKRAIDPPDDILYPVPKGCAVPGSGSSVRLHRRRLTLPDAGDCWIYALPGARL